MQMDAHMDIDLEFDSMSDFRPTSKPFRETAASNVYMEFLNRNDDPTPTFGESNIGSFGQTDDLSLNFDIKPFTEPVQQVEEPEPTIIAVHDVEHTQNAQEPVEDIPFSGTLAQDLDSEPEEENKEEEAQFGLPLGAESSEVKHQPIKKESPISKPNANTKPKGEVSINIDLPEVSYPAPESQIQPVPVVYSEVPKKVSTERPPSARRRRSSTTDSEIFALRKKLKDYEVKISTLQAELDKYEPQTFSDVIRSIEEGIDVSLEKYSALRLQRELLFAAVEQKSVVALEKIIIFSYNTLQFSIFCDLIDEFTTLHSFVDRFLSLKHPERLVDFLEQSGRGKKTILELYHLANDIKDFDQRIVALNRVKDRIRMTPYVWLGELIEEDIRFIQHVHFVEMNDRRLEATNPPIEFQHFKRPNLLKTCDSPIDLYYYCHFFHSTAPRRSELSHAFVKQSFNLPQQMKEVQKLRAMANLGQQQEIVSHFISKAFFSGRLKCTVPMKIFIRELCATANMKEPFLRPFVAAIRDPSERTIAALEAKSYEIAVQSVEEAERKNGHNGSLYRKVFYRVKQDLDEDEAHEMLEPISKFEFS
ncbi:hypothetical protein PCE1_003676 [Barthelona sp. PCE]